MSDVSDKKITEADVRHIARLARIAVSEGELSDLAKELERVREWVAQVREVNVKGVASYGGVFDMELRRREDKAEKTDKDDILKNAPDEREGFFVVPKVVEARNGLIKKDISAVDLAENSFQNMEGISYLNAFITTTRDRALQQAEESDKRLREGKARPLEGIPIGVKDLFCTRGIRTTAASKMLGNFVPPYESEVTRRLWEAGALCIGKLNMDEFAMGSKSTFGIGGHVANPWVPPLNGDSKYTVMSPGGSSGGASASVAAGLCLGAVASDTGGSIRQPAAWTGTVGIKPTYGRCSRYGMIAFASSLDQAGVIAKNVRDTAVLLGVIAGFDPKDSTSVNKPVPNYENFIGKNIKGLKIGSIKNFEKMAINFSAYDTGKPFIQPASEMMRLWEESKKWLRDAGAEIVEIDLPHVELALPAYYIIAPAEASSNLARYDGVRYGLREEASDVDEMYEKSRRAFGEEVRRRILIGTYVLSAGYYDAYYLQALKVRKRLIEDFNKAFEKVELLLGPTTPSSAMLSGEYMDEGGREDVLYNYLQDIMTVPANLAGLPAISVPVGKNVKGGGMHEHDAGMPLGIQLIAPPFQEERLFQAGQIIENAAGTFTPPTRWWEKASDEPQTV